MKNPGIRMGLFVGAVLTAPLLGVLYLASEFAELPFSPYDIFDRLTRELPGSLVTFGIDVMIDTLRFFGLGVADSAKTAERAMAVLQFLFVGMAAGAIYFRIARNLNRQQALWTALGIGAVFGVITAIVSIGLGGSTVPTPVVFLWLVGVSVIWGWTLSAIHARLRVTATDPALSPETTQTGSPISRRQFVIKVGSAAAVITVASTGIGSLLSAAARRELDAELAATATDPSPGNNGTILPNANDPVVAATGTRPEYTPLEDHYSVSIGTREIVIDPATWTLPITGLVANPASLTISDLRDNFEPMTHFVTLSCISGRVGSALIGTTEWTGVSVQDVLAQVQPTSDAKYLDISSADGFHELVDINEINNDERMMLCYEWDGKPLPIDHGFPLRIWRPDRYGMKQPRWIDSIKVTDKPRDGYWVQRGWDSVAQIQTTSVVDTVAGDSMYESEGQTLVPVGGIAFAGTRGISKVEVRVDEGPWVEAQLRNPLSGTTWVIWRYDWPFEAGEHFFSVRCAEGDGTPQIEEERGNRPSGARGIHSRRAKV
ncbi:MAG: molybdopterin-dependent oxidoreductase [Chloroflexi bacterium]|nr:molybdopterin-dependent oxidoreductase [Chloroflexota bacterium]